MKRRNSLLRSTLLALPVGAASIAVGFLAYNSFHPKSEQALDGFAIPTSDDTTQGRWPEVQFLSDSGIAPLSEAELAACKQKLPKTVEKEALAHPDNFGQRDPKDAIGRDIPHQPALIVLHETVISSPATIDLFQTPHPNDNDQSSYHVLINKSGESIRIVPDENRAYGSGYSRFGDFTIHSKSPNNFSINNVALHISLETPLDGRGDESAHSGYTGRQYDSLARQVLLWQAKYGIPIFRVTTHAWADRSHSRYDPRSFRWDLFDKYHREYATTCGLKKLTLI